MIGVEELVEITEEKEQASPFKLGTVVGLFDIGTAKIQFDGEDEPSEKEYSYLASYIPSIGDRIMVASVANTYVIVGKVQYKEEPEEQFEIPSDLARIVYGTYTGNGTTASRKIEVGFDPLLVFCFGDGTGNASSGRGISMSGAKYGIGKNSSSESSYIQVRSSFGIAIPEIVEGGFNVKESSSYSSLNENNKLYHYVAIG